MKQQNKQLLLFLSLLCNVAGLNAQSLLPELAPEPPSNANFYYRNFGQITDHNDSVRLDVQYYTEKTDPAMYMLDDRVSFVAHLTGDTSVSPTAPDTFCRIDMQFLCEESIANKNVGRQQSLATCGSLAAYEQGQDYLNYYLPHCDTGITDVPGYARIVYEDAFPNIDVHFYSNSFAPKIYFVVKPGGDPSDIQLMFSGQDSIGQLTGNPTLRMYLGDWSLAFHEAIAYQIDAGNNATLLPWQPQWQHNGTGQVGFSSIGTYNAANTLVIAVGGAGEKPTAIENLDWSVYYGHDGAEESARVHAVDDDLYHAMAEKGNKFPVEYGQTDVINANAGNYDWYISKFSNTVRQWAASPGVPCSTKPLRLPQAIRQTVFLSQTRAMGHFPKQPQRKRPE
ncbi:MAG: hypothetical protein QM642_00345 [Edaphocola sp.]